MFYERLTIFGTFGRFHRYFAEIWQKMSDPSAATQYRPCGLLYILPYEINFIYNA